MRLSLAHLIAAASLAALVLSASAQQADVRQRQSAYEAWRQAIDVEQKIALGERVLAAEQAATSSPPGIPRERLRAEVSAALGALYVNRAQGVRADNLEKAIGHLQVALAVYKRQADAQAWAAAHNVLGIAYWQRIRGGPAENQETAIAHFEAAQEVFTHAAYPQEWAQLQNNLAVVHWNRVLGERAANVEEAIARFEAALTVVTQDSDPARWAAAQNNLANAYGSRLSGEPADNREQAIVHLKAALKVFTRADYPNEWAQAQNNLAIAYMALDRGDRADNQDKAIAALQAALDVFTRDSFPQQWAQAQYNLANVYAIRIRGEKPANRRQAVAAFEAALSVFTRDADPLGHLRASRRLGHVLLDAGEWQRAAPVHASAREAFLMLFGQGLSDAEARALIADAGPLFAELAYAAVQRGETERAFELANEGRARLMAVALKLQTLQLAPEKRRRLDELRIAIRIGQEAVEASHGTERTAAIDRLSLLRRELLAIVQQGSRGHGQQDNALAEARRLAAEGRVVAMPIVTQWGTKLMLVTRGKSGGDLTVVDLPNLTTGRLSDVLVGDETGRVGGWLGGYFANYMQGAEFERRWPDWISAIDHIGPQLWTLVGSTLDTALRQRGVERGARLVWLPSGWLGILPLGLAQDPVSGRRLTDDYEIAYAPSVELLAAGRELAAAPARATLAAIVNPTGDLPGTESEGNLVASRFQAGSRTILNGAAATPDAVIEALGGKSYWHFASHGGFSWTDARQSALIMHGGAPLSVGRLLEADGLGRPRLVVLSACETEVYEITASPDEFIGLPGTFMALGAAGVLGTLWPVSDAATALLIAKFYELHLGAGLSPPTALRQAQAWLRQATSEELGDYAKVAAADGQLEGRHLAAIEQELTPNALARSNRSAPTEWTTGSSAAPGAPTSAKPPAHPYAHPYYWAGFIYSGQ